MVVVVAVVGVVDVVGGVAVAVVGVVVAGVVVAAFSGVVAAVVAVFAPQILVRGLRNSCSVDLPVGSALSAVGSATCCRVYK